MDAAVDAEGQKADGIARQSSETFSGVGRKLKSLTVLPQIKMLPNG